jgi:hypothetical protein
MQKPGVVHRTRPALFILNPFRGSGIKPLQITVFQSVFRKARCSKTVYD